MTRSSDVYAAPKYDVFIIDSAQVPHGEDDSIEREILQDCARVQLLRLHSEEEFLPYSHCADAIVLWHHIQLTAGIMGRLTKTRLIVRNGVGYDNVDVAAAATAGIAVAISRTTGRRKSPITPSL